MLSLCCETSVIPDLDPDYSRFVSEDESGTIRDVLNYEYLLTILAISLFSAFSFTS